MKKVKAERVVKDEPKTSNAKPIFTTDIEKMQCTMHSTSGQAEQSVPLVAGPDGCLVGKFEGIVHTTELPNLMLLKAPKPKPKQVKKRPGAAAPGVAAEAPAAPPVAAAPAPVPPGAPAAAAPDKNDYGIMWYAKSKCIGIRAKFGAKNQVLSFGGTHCTKTEAEMRAIAKTIVADLHDGMAIIDARQKGKRLAGVA